ncbi:DUF3262 family protein [Alicycliphilus denitrificans]|uniref:DUF3262 family protein n=1 Tax=Alicycliphilus denitrificans TaxID=179636 RepID=UPI0038514EE6
MATTVNNRLEPALLDSMKAGFMDAAGVDPSQMKAVIFSLVFAVILIIAAWIGKQILESFGSGGIESGDLIRLIISLVVVVLATLAFLGWF